MKLVLRHGERTVEAVVEPHGDGLRVTLDGRVYELDAAELGAGVTSLRFTGASGVAQHEVAVQPLPRRGAGDRYRVTLSGGDVREVEVLDPLAHLAEQAGAGAATAGRGQVTAYMPGRVVELLVAEGAEVAAGQGVVVLEAMKMENEIPAEHAGTVRHFYVTPGQTVEAGEPLFEIG